MIDIHSKAPYPSNELSNFARHSFIIDGIECASMEGFLQSLKFRSITKQREICRLSGKEAKTAPGRFRNWRWKLTQSLYWNGKRFRRSSLEYSSLITRAYDALFMNNEFKQALTDTNNDELRHSIGGHNKRKTVLTEREFIDQLYRLRERL